MILGNLEKLVGQGFNVSLACRLKQQGLGAKWCLPGRFIVSGIRIFKMNFKSHQSQKDGGHF